MQLRHEPIQCKRESCVGCFGSLKLLPQLTQFLALIRWQYPEETIRGDSFANGLIEFGIRVVK
jgi:hypothetical protein